MREGRWSRLPQYWWVSVLSVGAFFAAWAIIGATGAFASIPPLPATIETLLGEISSGALIGPAWETIRLALVGLAISLGLGVLIGLVLGSSRRLARVFDPLVTAAYSAPLVLLIPVLGIYVGVQFRGQTVLVVLFCVFAIIWNVEEGVRTLSKDVTEVARAFRIEGIARFRKIVIPGVMPFIMTGFRIGAGKAIQGAVTAQVLLNVTGLGAYLNDAVNSFDVLRLVAGTFFVSLISFATIYGARALERRALRWRSRGRTG